MNDEWISRYIDDELSLDDKIAFVETVHGDRRFKDDTLDLLRQEKLIRAEVVDHVPAIEFTERRRDRAMRRFRPALLAAGAGLAAAALLAVALRPPPEPLVRAHRFVIYQPGAKQVELAGSFSGWKRMPLKPSGQSGYWEITLELPEGEHRFSYLIEGARKVPDPTIAVREIDDFGGENSILKVAL
ncbi:MAG TPA: glycogen-binding domain-containing protein [Bryobacteraceae bacterium]|nr:glycogen-binding domain-containing protein [Bryobacteraceae bacterium]